MLRPSWVAIKLLRIVREMELPTACLPSSSIGLGVLCFWERRIELGVVGSIPIALRIFLFAIYNMFSFNGMHFQLVSLLFIILRMCMFFATSFICRFEFIIIYHCAYSRISHQTTPTKFARRGVPMWSARLRFTRSTPNLVSWHGSLNTKTFRKRLGGIAGKRRIPVDLPSLG